jgi:hypothetical protein
MMAPPSPLSPAPPMQSLPQKISPSILIIQSSLQNYAIISSPHVLCQDIEHFWWLGVSLSRELPIKIKSNNTTIFALGQPAPTLIL